MPCGHYGILSGAAEPVDAPELSAMHAIHPPRPILFSGRAPTVSFGTLLCLMLLSLCGRVEAQVLHTSLDDDEIETGVLGESQLIEADVGAETEVTDITLFHRFDGEREYRSSPMQPTGSPRVFAARVPTEGVQARRLEFYIVAEDAGGDALLRGNSFEPLVRELVLPAQDLAARDVPSPDEPGPSFGRSRYLWYGLGILAAGVLIAAAVDDSGDDGGGAEGCGEAGCDLTLVLPPPQ